MKTVRGFRSILLNVIQEEPPEDSAAVPFTVTRRRRFTKPFQGRGVQPSPSLSPRRIRSSRGMEEKKVEDLREMTRRSSDSCLNTDSTGTAAFKVLPPIKTEFEVSLYIYTLLIINPKILISFQGHFILMIYSLCWGVE